MPLELDAYTINPGSFVVVVGRRGTGKTVLIRDLLTRLPYKHVVAFSPTESSQRMMAEFAPTANIFAEYDPLVLRRVLEFQRTELSAAYARAKINNSEARDPNLLRSVVCVFDDCYRPSKDHVFQHLVMNSRTLRVTTVLAVGSIGDLLPVVRANIDYCFAFRESSMCARMKLYTNIFNIFETYEAFRAAFQEATRERGEALVMDNTSNRPSIAQDVRRYRASTAPPSFAAALRGDPLELPQVVQLNYAALGDIQVA